MSYIDNIPNELKLSLSSYIERYNIIVEHRILVTELGQQDCIIPTYIVDVEYVDIIIYNVYYPQYFFITLPIFITRNPNYAHCLISNLDDFIHSIENDESALLKFNNFILEYKYSNSYHQLNISNDLIMLGNNHYYFKQRSTILQPFKDIFDYLVRKIYYKKI